MRKDIAIATQLVHLELRRKCCRRKRKIASILRWLERRIHFRNGIEQLATLKREIDADHQLLSSLLK